MHVNVAIVGLDRVGTSFGLALKRYESHPKAEHSFTIIGSDPKGYVMKTAKKMGAVDNFHRALLKATDNADLLFINVPFGNVEELYTRLGPALKPGAVILDTSLLKQRTIEWARQHLLRNEQGQPLAYMVGITPIVNVEALFSGDLGVEGARADLFDNADVLLMPDAACPSEAISLAQDVVKLMGGRVRFMDPIEHDGLIAATEELPLLLGTVLFYMLQQGQTWVELRRMINPTMALTTQHLRCQTPKDLLALFTQNRQNLARHLEGLIGLLDQVRDALVSEDGDEQIETFLNQVQKTWETWDIKRHSGKWEDVKELELLPGPFGSVDGFMTLVRGKTDQDEDDK